MEVITSITYPNTKKTLQSFFVKINFVQRFILGFGKNFKPLQNMIKKDMTFKWFKEENEGFYIIKESIAVAPNLKIQDFEKEFILYNFPSNTSYVAILTQNNDEGDEVHVSFRRFHLQGVELKNPNVEKKGIPVLKVVKNFKPYLLKASTKVIVPHLEVSSLFVQKDMGERRGNWMTTF